MTCGHAEFTADRRPFYEDGFRYSNIDCEHREVCEQYNHDSRVNLSEIIEKVNNEIAMGKGDIFLHHDQN